MKKSSMNVSLALVVSAFAGATIFFSCSKNERELTPSSPAHPTVAMNSAPYTPCPDVANPANPFDYVGAAHNEGLEYILAHQPEWVNDEIALKEMFIGYTGDFVCDNGYGPAGDCFGITHNQLVNTVNTYESTPVNDIVADLGSPELQAYMNQLLEEVDTYTDSTQIDSLLASIKRIESDVNASDLDADEKQTFLQSSSVGRYSMCYWFQEYQKSHTSWTPPNPPVPAGKINWKRIAKIAAGDIVGAACGGVGGAIVVSAICAL